MILPKRHRGGFTLIEIMIVVTIIGILALLAIPAVRKAVLRSQDVRFMNDLRLVSGGGLDLYAFTFGDYPADAPVGVVPAGLESFLPKRFSWTEAPSIGGQWDWDRAPDKSSKVDGLFYAGLTVVDPGRTRAQLQVIDAKFDDGDLATGRFIERGNGDCTYILAP